MSGRPVTPVSVDWVRQHVVRPALHCIELWSLAAEEQVVATGAHESEGFRHVVQKGPLRWESALSWWQMEPATYRNLWKELVPRRSGLGDALRSLTLRVEPGSAEVPPLEELLVSPLFAAAMCRIRYLWDPKPLPDPGDVVGLARTWKRAYNTSRGKGTVDEFIKSYEKFVKGGA